MSDETRKPRDVVIDLESMHARTGVDLYRAAAETIRAERQARARAEAERDTARDLEEARAFLRRTAMTGGSIVSSASMTPRQIAIARAADRMLVMPDGYGFVYVPGPRFCACGRPESDCDQSRAGCPKENDKAREAMSEAERAELRRLLAEATPRPWRASRTDMDSYTVDPSGDSGEMEHVAYLYRGEESRSAFFGPANRADLALIVALVNAAPALLDELDRLAARVAELEQQRLPAETTVLGVPIDKARELLSDVLLHRAMRDESAMDDALDQLEELLLPEHARERRAATPAETDQPEEPGR